MLPIMAAGLSSIIFSIAVDVAYLNSSSRSVEVPTSGNRLDPPEAQVPVAITTSSSSKLQSDSQPSFPSKRTGGMSSHHSASDLSAGGRPVATFQPRPLPTSTESGFRSRGIECAIRLLVCIYWNSVVACR